MRTMARVASPAAVRVPVRSGHTPQQALLAVREDEHPFALIGQWAGGGAIVGSRPVEVACADADPFELLDGRPPVDAAVDGVVGGGWFGWLGYGLGGRVERLPPPPPRPVALPPFWLAFYDHVLRLDASGQWWFEALDPARGDDRLPELAERLAARPPAPRRFSCGAFVSRPGRAAHAAAVRECTRYIAAGDLYQANICTRLEGAIEGEPLDLFARASAELRPPYAAYLEGPWGAVASMSPELFLRRSGREVITRPIKGTAPRATGAAALAGSEKDVAENVMIVDLMRNDLGRTCAIGSVRTEAIARPEPHPGIWHLVSEVRGTLPGDAGDGDLVRAAFPPGSVTGAPKIKAMEVIATLESTGREAYTGAIGFASPLAGLELNVAIRTFEVRGARVWLGAGGGVVADSDPELEYEECLDKVRPLVTAIGSSLAPEAQTPAAAIAPTRLPRPDPALGVFETALVEGGIALELDGHLERLARSLRELYGEQPDADLRARAREAAAGCGGRARLRISFRPAEGFVVETQPLRPPEAATKLVPLVVPGGLGEHKWNDRRLVNSVDGEALILDLTGEVLEAGAGAIVLREGERLVSPPADGRILPSVTLATLPGVVREPVAFERLAAADELLVVSAVRRRQPAVL